MRASTSRAAETTQHYIPVFDLRARASVSRAATTSEARETRREIERSRQTQSRSRIDLKKAAFNYNKDYDYKMHPDVVIGPMASLCLHCRALTFHKETPGMCCSNDEVNLPPLPEPPEPLLTYVSGITRQFKHFLSHIRKYNPCFQMTSFEATNIINIIKV